jgi:protein SCO1/2
MSLLNNKLAACAMIASAVCATSLAIGRAMAGDVEPVNAANASSDILTKAGVSPGFGNLLPLDIAFVDANGNQIRLGECFRDRPVILHLVYYECPMLCKLSSDGLFKTLSVVNLKLGADFTIVTISIDPREDPKLSRRARDLAAERCGRNVVESGWHFLTGQEDAIAAVTKAVGFRYTFDEKTRQFAHAAGLFVLTPDGTVSRFLSGIEYSPRDLRLALVEASDGKIGTATDQALLLCYMYDPTTGKYGLAILTVLRAAGAVTVLSLAIAVVTMIRRDRARGTSGLPTNAKGLPA